ncbi:hypothetical protein [Streptomyces sp. NPDC006638]|uniref:hypothetical protein n=1 Tax=Streptomyces sp. NPDC006638 TaxID=3157183 RepID=UPI0033A4EC4E
MPGTYSGDYEGIRGLSRHIADASRTGEEIGPRFDTDSSAYEGCWGEEGGDDEFANQVGPQARKEREMVLDTLLSITSGYRALVDAVDAEAENVRRPQTLAMDDIRTYSADSETRR